MKFAFLVIAIFINFFNQSLIKSEEKIFSEKNKIENIAQKESITEEKTEIKKIHIVKSGDTLSSISKLYSISFQLERSDWELCSRLGVCLQAIRP